MRKLLAVLTLASFLTPGAVHAVPINLFAGVPITLSQNLEVGGLIEYEFVVAENLKIPDFAFTASGTNAGVDVSNIRFGLTNPPTGEFAPITVFGNTAVGVSFIDGGLYSKGDTFSIFISDGISNTIGTTVSFSPMPIPLPAAGLLMLTALVGGGLVLRNRKTA